MQDKDFDMRLNRAECLVKVAEIVEKTIRAVFRGLKEDGKLRHGSGTFDYGDRAVWL